jgi:two-component system sensor kinase FixL
MFSSETHALMEAAVDAIVVIDHRGRILATNDAACRTFGYRTDEMLGESVGILMPAAERAAHDRYMADYLRTGSARIIGIGRPLTAQRKDGSGFPAHLSVGRIADAEPARFIGVVRDLTAESAATSALKFERDRANAFLELHDAILIELDARGCIRDINARGARHLGASPGELAGRDWLGFMREESQRDSARMLLANALASTCACDAELEMGVAAAEPRRIHCHCIALRAADGAAAGWLCSGTDVTARAQREAEALVAQERMGHVALMATVGELAAGIAHEINQPLTAITTYARACEHYLDMPSPDTVELRDALREISAEGLRAGEIVRQMRRLVRNGRSERASVNVNFLLGEIEPRVNADAHARGSRVNFRLAHGLPAVDIDVAQIQHAVLILVRNALEAVDSLPGGGGTVEIASRLTGEGEVEISVTDNGPGVAAAVSERLFEPFATTKRHGTGLGLATCRSLVQAHGGKIGTVGKDAPGASFYVRLPAAAGVLP